MRYVKYKLLLLFICAKVDNLGNVLFQLTRTLHRSQKGSTEQNSTDPAEISYQRLRVQWPTMAIVGATVAF